MNDEKKKVTILGCLFACGITLGAFQFLGHKRPPPVLDPVKPVAAPVETAAAPKVENPLFEKPLAARDPFQAPADSEEQQKGPTTMPKPLDKPAPFPSRTRLAGAKPFDPLPGTLTPMHGGIGAGGPAEYDVVGVIQGVKPMAVVDDGHGNQKLVPLGGAIDGETRLQSISSNSVSVVSRGHVRRIAMGGNPVGK